MVLFLFSMGVTKGKWGTLLNTLLDFKVDYDRNAPLARSAARARRGRAAALCRQGPQGSRRRDVGAAAQEQAGPLAGAGLRHAAEAEDDAATRLPAPDGRRRREGAARQDGRSRRRASASFPIRPAFRSSCRARTSAPADGPWLTYLRTLQEWGHLFPGFAKEVEGTEEHDGVFHVYCLK